MVLGHSHCGAVSTTIEELRQPTENQSPNLQAIVDRVRPAVSELMRTHATMEFDELVEHGVRANIISSVDHLRHGSEILERLSREDGLLIVGAEYSLETRSVEFFTE